MKNINFIGIDVSKKNLHIYQLEIKEICIIENNYDELCKFLKKFDTTSLIIYEPTGVYSKTLEKVCNDL